MYSRQVELIGKENQEKLRKDVLVVGCGGLGNIIATTISCVGLRRIYLIDFDKIEPHNLHRQFQFFEKDLGKNKSDVLAKRIKRCSDTDIFSMKGYFSRDFDFDIDLIFDATDNYETRKEIDKYAKERGIPWVYASVDEFRGQVGLFKTSEYEKLFKDKREYSKGQFPPMVNIVGSIAAMVGLKELMNPQKEYLYHIEYNDELVVKKFDLA
ncbi:MAG: ThiF family adenylyltransferase [Epsilonproteobacteria bacterium]|nr:ThiF family adenylyltransferase [Campylobacterota bacterium]